ncbi:DinB family protein [Pedobacter insulae]|uniref:DinB superfamily protein n=1 Tax=Pedobacter insulae TaxID=414048 RepID=A0A1I2YZL7_9SPHI|nr:DinB family protein [Pedobacter insulae]SFH31033.1 DinB superfamily protein [Pedobacter insulae]
MSLVDSAKDEILALVDGALLDFKNIKSDDWNAKPNPIKWSKKELLGHLIDSASNNLRRLIVAQYEQGTKIVYDQDKWVCYQGYQEMSIDHVITLWDLLNRQLALVISRIPQNKLDNTCDTGLGKAEVHSLVYFIEEYIVHLKYHLKQVRQDLSSRA